MSDPVRRAEERTDDPPPKAPFWLVIDMNADTWPDMLHRLNRLIEHISEHGPECNEVSGGGGGSHSVTIHRRDIAVADYHDELEAWLERRRAARGEQ